jgi:hypothetical protein
MIPKHKTINLIDKGAYFVAVENKSTFGS